MDLTMIPGLSDGALALICAAWAIVLGWQLWDAYGGARTRPRR